MTAALLTALLLLLPLLGAWRVATRMLDDWRLGLGVAALAWGLWAVAASELLSLGAPNVVGEDRAHFHRAWLLPVWLLPALLAMPALWSMRDPLRSGRRLLHELAASWSSKLDRLLLAGIGVCLALTLLVALVSAPNNWDSMTYHLARIATWHRLGGVAHYATNVEPQLYQPPGAELLIAQGYLISGGDRLAALVQWGAYAGCIVLAAAAVQALGGERRAQLAGATLAATVPTAILQATSTQNDLLLAFWILLAATLAAHIWSGAGRSARWVSGAALAASAALGMAALTKGTGLMFALPVGLLLAVATLRRVGARRTLALAGLGLLLVALPNIGQWSRNHETFGSFVSAGSTDNAYRVTDPDAASLTANLVRNATNHLDTPLPGWNNAVDRGARRMLDTVGIDADDPRTTFMDKPFRVGPFGPHEDHAGSLLLLVLGIAAAFGAVRSRIRGHDGSGLAAAWLSILAAQILLFCLLITWQNWHVRLHLPIVMATAPFVATWLARLRSPRWIMSAAVLGLLAAPLFLVLNVTRPLVGDDSILTQSRTSTYFIPRPQLEDPYREAVGLMATSGVTDAGLITSVDDWHYPLTVLGAQRTPQIRFRELFPAGASARYAAAERPIPDAVICSSCVDSHRQALQDAGLRPAPLTGGTVRQGRGDDVVALELWIRPGRLAASPS